MNTSDFALKVHPLRGRSYPVSVLESPAGQGRGRLQLPSYPGELRYFWVEPDPDWSAFEAEEDWEPDRFVKRAKDIGGRLFKALFSGQVRQLYERSLGFLEARPGSSLRLRLHVDVSDSALARVATLPWELLFDAQLGKFLALDRRTPVVRSLDLAQSGRPLAIVPPLRVLIAAAQPKSFPLLDLERERRRIASVWHEGKPAPMDVLEHAAPNSLRDTLLAGRHQVLHFLGHGVFARSSGQGSLVFEREDGAPFQVAGSLLANLLSGLPELRLVVLNACETTRLRRDGREPYASVATALVQAGLPAVVAMNAPIRDRAAAAFSARLYERLSASDPIEAAVTEARLAIAAERPETVDWGIPVLYLRGPGGVLAGQQVEVEPLATSSDSGLFMPDRPPEDLVDRPGLVEPVIAGLLAQDASSTVGLAAAFRGAGGYGKTTLARAVCQDPRIRQAFSDGILWITLGEQPGSLIAIVEDLIYTLSRVRPGYSSLDAAAGALAALLEPRRMLIVIDDVWSATHLRPFLRGGPRCARLITTRDRTVLPTAAAVVQVDAMQHDEALRLLTGGLPEEQRPALEKLSAQLGHWPLLLRLVNGVLRDRLLGHNQDLAGALLYAGAALRHHGLTAFDVADPADRNRAVASTLAVSLDQLRPEAQDQFLDLAIFPEDADVPFSVLEKLWADISPTDVETLCVRFHQLSLLLKTDLSKRSIRLHDVIRSFLHRRRLPDLPAVHSRFLAAARQGVSGAWRDLPPDETYLWRHLSYHLEAAGLTTELTETVQDLAFLVARVMLGDPHGAEGDLVRAERLTPEDEKLRALHSAFANAKHLLIPCTTREEIYATFVSRLLVAAELNELVTRADGILGRPRLHARFPLPDSPDPALLRTLASFGGQVVACSVSADGRWVVTACEDGSVILWDAMLGNEVWTVQEAAEVPDEDEELRVCDSYSALSADASTLLAADGAGTVRAWDVATRVELCRLEQRGRVIAAALSADGRRGVCRWQSGRLLVFETKGGRVVLDLPMSDAAPAGCALNTGGSLVLAALGTNLLLRDLRNSQHRTWQAHESACTACAISGDGKLALSASRSGEARMWDIASGSELRAFEHGSGVSACALTAHGDLAITTSERGTAVLLWDTATGKRLRSLEGHLGGACCCSVDANGHLVATGGADLTAKLWRDPLVARGTLPPFRVDLRDAAVDASGRLMAGAALDATLRIWDLPKGDEILSLQHPKALMGCALTPDGTLAISVAEDGGARIWNIATGGCTVLPEKGPPFLCCALSPQGNLFAAARRDGRIRVWDLRQQNEICALDGGSSVPTRCRFSRDGRYLLLASRDGLLRLWDLSNDAEPWVIARHADEADGCAFSADGGTIASACRDGLVRIWDRSGRLLIELEGHAGPVRDCAFQPGEGLLASVSADIGIGSTVKVWQPEKRRCLASLRVEGELSTCGWLPDGAALFAAGQYGAYLFDWEP